MEICDVFILGGGPAGTVTAGLLAKAGLKVIIVEKSVFEKPRAGESLAPAVKPLFQELKLWEQFLALNPLPSYGTQSAWGSQVAGVHTHMTTVHSMGWHVDRLAMDKMLAAEAEKAGARLLINCKMMSVRNDSDNNFYLQLRHRDNEYPVKARFVIDASGRNAFLSTQLGAERIVFDRLVGIGVQFADEDAGNHLYTMVETTSDGWWYSAPVPLNRSVAMLMTDGDLQAKNKFDHLPAWRQALSETELTAARVKGREVIWGPEVFSAVSQRMIRAVADMSPWLAVGDAGLSVDPISGSGVLRALRTAKEAANAVLANLNGDKHAIADFETRRNEDCHQYLLEWASYYGIEKRWPNSPFWKRRAMAAKSYLEDFSEA